MKYINGCLVLNESERNFFEEGDQFSLEMGINHLELVPYEVVEIDLEGLSRDSMEELLHKCSNKTLSEVICEILMENLKD